jgi:oxygen-dependent protoporphyrinogen oxidase
MQTLVNGLRDARNDSVLTGVHIASVRKHKNGYEVDASAASGDRTYRSRSLVFAVPAYAMARMPAAFDLPVRDALSSISYPPVAMVFLGYRTTPTKFPLDGFGFLVPEKENRNILGTIWSSSLFPGRAPEGGTAFTTFVGGSRQPDRALLPEENLIEDVRSDLKSLLGVGGEPDLAYVRVWKRAIPQYKVGHLDIVRALESFEGRNPGLHISGNFRGGVSVSDCVKRACEVGSDVAGLFTA